MASIGLSARGTRRALLFALLFGTVLAAQGCYYAQAVRGQLDVMGRREPLADVIVDPATEPALAARLAMLGDARDFATEALGLPDNGSYRSYADLERDFVVWNVFAAPEFALEPETWCYLFVGCLAYRGYFDADDARRYAAKLADDGHDVFVGSVAAYSTLGRFADPILNTMLARSDADLVALLFHELAHQRLYLRGDTAFNEAFATAVAEIGLRRWFDTRGDAEAADRWFDRQALAAERLALIGDARAELSALYGSDVPEAEKRARKRAVFDALGQALAALDGQGWESASLNNAWLASLSLYRGYVPAFRALYARCDRELECFYREAERLGDLEDAARRDALGALEN